MAKNRTMAAVKAKCVKASIADASENKRMYMSTAILYPQDRPKNFAMTYYRTTKPYALTYGKKG